MLETYFPDWQRSEIEKAAVKRSMEINAGHTYEPDYNSNTDRLAVNWLRHEFTDYNDNQSVDRFIEACTAIASRYPWLKSECDFQIEKKKKVCAEGADLLMLMREIRAQEHKDKLRLSEESAKAVSDLHIRQTVQVRSGERERVGEITWIGSLRVEVLFRIATGRKRRYRLYASVVTPVVQNNLQSVDSI
jgi:hypothetical protein